MKAHLIGIAGTGMGSLAGLLRAKGHDVRGSDQDVYPPMSTQLALLGIGVATPYDPRNLDWGPERVIVGNACRRDHVEVVAAQERGLPLVSMPAALAEEFLDHGAHSVVVAGTHGKTTTASLVAQILSTAGSDPSFLIGGVPIAFGASFRLGRGAHFVVEGDEYDTAFFDKGPKFLHYRPRTAIVTSVEYDHADIYASIEAVAEAFRAFVRLIPEDGVLVLGSDSPHAAALAGSARARVETYGRDGAWRLVHFERVAGGRARFEVMRGGASFGRFEAALTGEHNLWNAVAAIAACANLGLSAGAIAEGLAAFAGVRRRQEVRGVAQGVTVVDDFAHHPTAIRETLRALRGRFGRAGRLVALFEPRSATSRRNVMRQETAAALAGADEVAIGPVVGLASIPEAERLDPAQLAADVRAHNVPARTFESADAIVEHLAPRVRPGDVVVALSSGSFGGVCHKLLASLGDPVTPAGSDDAEGIGAMLESVGMGRHRFEQHLQNFLVIRHGSDLVGCVGLEIYGDAALLRSLAVVPERRGEGLGWTLADAALARARERGCRRIVVFTRTAADFFAEKLGFRRVEAAGIDPRLHGSAIYADGRALGATCMELDLDEAAAADGVNSSDGS